MWALGKTLDTPIPKEVTDPNYLNSAILFYDENRQLVQAQIKDCLNHLKMGYEFEKWTLKANLRVWII